MRARLIVRQSRPIAHRDAKPAPRSEDQPYVAAFFQFPIALALTDGTFEKSREWNGRAISVV
jgi:hypothetical protein